MRRFAFVIACVVASSCSKSPPSPEVRVGGPYRSLPPGVQPESLERDRGLEVSTIARGQVVYFRIMYRAVYQHRLAIEVVDGTGKQCYASERVFTEEAYRENPKGWGGEGLPLPTGHDTKCSEGDLASRAFVPGHYTARFSLDGNRVGERSFDVR